MNSMKRQNDRILKGTPQVSRCPICYWRNNSRKNEVMKPEQKYPVVDVTGDRSKVLAVKNNIA